MERHENIDYWEKVLEDLPDSYKGWFIAEEKFLVENVSKDSRVLEVGCGDGRSLNYLLDVTQNLWGIDNDPKAIEDTKNNLGGLNFYVEDGRNLSFEDNFFDYVICMTTPANFGEDKEKFYKEMKRVVKDSGQILLSVFNEDAFEERKKLYDKLGAEIREVDNGKVIFNKPIGTVSEQFSREELEEIFRIVGLKILEIKKEGIGYFIRLRK